jgi:hypothetical protein
MKTLSRGIFTVVVACTALLLTRGVASAGPIVFTVNEGAVPGADSKIVTADDITGKYDEALTFTSATTFSANILVIFTDYVLGGLPVSNQIGAPVPGGETTDTNLYTLYALVTVSGSFVVTSPLPGVVTDFFFPTSSTANIYLDPLRDTTVNFATLATANTGDDIQVMTANTLASPPPTSFGQVTTIGGQVVTGSYALWYSDATVLDAAYWPTLASINIQFATASGDVDPTSAFPTHITGDTDIQFFQGTAGVPEPTSLVLLGTGLLATRFGIRRRNRKSKA